MSGADPVGGLPDPPDEPPAVRVRITTPVHPTEDELRVAEAVRAVFPGADVEREADRLVATTDSLDRFAERLRQQRILDTAREALREGRRGDAVEFALAKQPATTGTVTFAVGDPAELGDLHVRVTVEEGSAEALLAWLAPPTDAEGHPIEDPGRRE